MIGGTVTNLGNWNTRYNASTQVYVANLTSRDGSTLLIVSEATPLKPESDKTKVGDFKRAMLFGPQDDIAAKVENISGELVFIPTGRASQQDLAAYLDAAIVTGQNALADYFRQVSKLTKTERYRQLNAIAAIREPPNDIMDKLRKGELKALEEAIQGAAPEISEL